MTFHVNCPLSSVRLDSNVMSSIFSLNKSREKCFGTCHSSISHDWRFKVLICRIILIFCTLDNAKSHWFKENLQFTMDFSRALCDLLYMASDPNHCKGMGTRTFFAYNTVHGILRLGIQHILNIGSQFWASLFVFCLTLHIFCNENYSEILLLRPPKMKISYLLKTLIAKFKLLFSSFSTPSVPLIRDHFWECPKVVFKTTFGQCQRWS